MFKSIVSILVVFGFFGAAPCSAEWTLKKGPFAENFKDRIKRQSQLRLQRLLNLAQQKTMTTGLVEEVLTRRGKRVVQLLEAKRFNEEDILDESKVFVLVSERSGRTFYGVKVGADPQDWVLISNNPFYDVLYFGHVGGTLLHGTKFAVRFGNGVEQKVVEYGFDPGPE